MAEPEARKPADDAAASDAGDEAELGRLWREVLLRLSFLYFVPIVLLAVFFHVEFQSMVRDYDAMHLTAMAEGRAATLDLFLSERLINLSNLLDDPAFAGELEDGDLDRALSALRQTSDAFVELGCLDEGGGMVAYAGPHPALGSRSYADEPWFRALERERDSSIITDIYRGFRDQPHFTIAVRRAEGGRYRVLRAVLTPDRIYQEITSGPPDRSLASALVNREGIYQVVAPGQGEPLGRSPFRPPAEPRSGTGSTSLSEGERVYGYSWLTTSPWAVVVHGQRATWAVARIGDLYRNIVIFTVAFFILGGMIIYFHARSSVRRLWRARKRQRELSGQLVQAAKLASVGELAAGIAHEINNPLAVIAEEVGLLKDLMDPELGGSLEDEDLKGHLDIMEGAVFRGRDITRKLLGFVRRTEVRLEEVDLHEVVDGVAEGLLGHELELAGVDIVKSYCEPPPRLVTDRNQLEQVLLNVMKNAVDAMKGSGTITLTTTCGAELVKVYVKDTGCGMSRDQLERVFNPFFTTKDPGKGTGLGLSVSQGIVHSLGGDIFVESELGVGSTFIVQLPLEQKR